MSTDIAKKQHYVWRKYLASWKNDPNDKDIWTALLQQNKVQKIGLMDVAQSSYFYKFEELSSDEIRFLRNYSCDLSEQVKRLADTIIFAYEIFAQLKRKNVAGEMPKDVNFEHDVKKAEVNSFENIQSKIEKMGQKLIGCQSIKEIEELAEENEIDFLCFIWVQYLRTRAMKSNVVKSLSGKQHLETIAEKCWPFFNFVVAMQMVECMLQRNDYHFIFVKNNGNVPFITGDQPVINTKSGITDDRGFVKELELYYPLSPKRALVIDFISGEKFSEIDIDDEYACQHNKMIYGESQIHVFANEENVLKEIMAHNEA